ncbi:MAG: DotU family type IV/VI secretion system protein [bacterium]|jgi:type VI secretion system protein ImpK
MGTFSTGPATAETWAGQRRPDNLALAFQEVLTAIVRLRSNRQVVTDAEVFRAQIREALRVADQEARNRGYTSEQSKLAVFAVVAFLDESILNLQQPVFAAWPRKPMQEELFGVHVAGEHFFQNIQRLLAMRDGHDVADVLEVYELCLLLGYRGRYGMAGQGELRSVIETVREKMRRIRGGTGELSPRWMPPPGGAPARRDDPWVKHLMWGAIGSAVLALALFGAYSVTLSSGASDITTIAAQSRQ